MKQQTIVITGEAAKARAIDALLAVDPAGPPVVMTLGRFRSKKTTPQCALIHVQIRHLARWVGDSEASVKDDVKERLWPKEVRRSPVTKQYRAQPKSTADLERDEAAEVIEQLYALGAEIGCPMDRAVIEQEADAMTKRKR